MTRKKLLQICIYVLPNLKSLVKMQLKSAKYPLMDSFNKRYSWLTIKTQDKYVVVLLTDNLPVCLYVFYLKWIFTTKKLFAYLADPLDI